jgi:hypothetical protein
MYKKIQHNIVEEHFDNIAAYQCGGNANVAMTARHIGANLFVPSVSVEDTPAAVKFREASRNFYTQYAIYIRSYLVAKVNGNVDEATSLKQGFDKFYPTEIGRIYGNYLSIDDGQRWLSPYQTLTTGIISFIDDISEGKNFNESFAKIKKNYEEFSTAMSSLLPDWDKRLIDAVWESVVMSLSDQITSRTNKDWASDMVAVNKLFEILVFGDAQKFSFSEILARGLIQRNTFRFQPLY